MGTQVDLTAPPLDQANVMAIYDNEGCAGIGSLFGANPITVGDCVEVDGKNYRITAVKVRCDANTVYEDGTPPGGASPDHVHPYSSCGVLVRFWLTAMAPGEGC